MTTTAIIPFPAPLAAPSDDAVDDGQSFNDAYDTLEPAFAAIPEAECLTVNTDPFHAATVAMGAAVTLRTLEEEIRTHLPTVDPTIVTRLMPAAKALASAQTRYAVASRPRLPIPEFDERLSRFRALFFADVRVLAARGLVDASWLSRLKSPNGHLNLAMSVMSLASFFRTNWATIEGRSGVTLQELEEAETLATRMVYAVGHRDHGIPPLIPATLARKQAFTYLVRLYDDILCAVTFLRWKKRDVAQWCPSLFYNKRARKPRKEASQGEDSR